MKSKPSLKKFRLKGKVVQTFETAGEKIAKIYLEPASVDFIIDSNEEINLSDIISFIVSINDNSLSVTSGNGGFRPEDSLK